MSNVLNLLVGSAMNDFTQILGQIENGDPRPPRSCWPPVYDEPRKLAAAKMAQEKPRRTLQATALVHEACTHCRRSEERFFRIRLHRLRSEPSLPDTSHHGFRGRKCGLSSAEASARKSEMTRSRSPFFK
jgi:hypothetical protein